MAIETRGNGSAVTGFRLKDSPDGPLQLLLTGKGFTVSQKKGGDWSVGGGRDAAEHRAGAGCATAEKHREATLCAVSP